MAVSGDYAQATVTNPSSALTDFSLLIDLSRMPAAWWSAVDTTDPTRGRATKGDGTTELACDWLAFDDVAQTGLVRVRWNGTLAASGTQQVRVFPPRLVNPAYAPGDTYGRHNAYASSVEAYWPLEGDAVDRTANAHTLIPFNSPTETNGQVGRAWQHNGTNQYHEIDNFSVATLPFTFSLWIRSAAATSTVEECALYFGNSADSADYFVLEFNNGDAVIWARDTTGGYYRETTLDVYDTTWHHVVGVYREEASARRIDLYLDGSLAGFDTDINPTFVATFDRVALARRGDLTPGQYFNGSIDDVLMLTVDAGADWVAHEYAQASNQATFWGTWSWSAGASDALTGSDLLAAAPVLDTPQLFQGQALIALELVSGVVLDTPTPGQAHVLAGVELVSVATLETPQLAEGGDGLVVLDLVSQVVVDVPALGQVHVLSALELVSQVVIDSPGRPATTTQPEGFFPGVWYGDPAGTRYRICTVCGLAFPEHQVITYRGKDYGIPCGDAEDIRSIIERRQRDVARGRDNRG